MRKIQLFCGIICAICLCIGLYLGLITSPPDYQQGEAVRIMYVHVPAAWCSLMIYSIMAISSFCFLIWRHSAADLLARHSAPIAWVMCAITLATGSLWGKPTWGAYWVWDARLTSMLILLIIISAYMLLAGQSDYNFKRQRNCAIFCLFGALNLPIIKFSVEWWNNLHQPSSVIRTGGAAIDSSMLTPLLIMAIGFSAYYGFVVSLRVQTALMQAKSNRLRRTL